MEISEQLEFTRNAGETRRFHTFPVLREQNIAEHSWHIAMLLHIIYGQEEPGLRPVLLMAALCHDAAEFIVGDIPAPAKRHMDEILKLGTEGPTFKEAWGVMEENLLSKVGLDWDKFLTNEERRMLKFCDSLDGAFYCIRERAMGNKLIIKCFNNFRTYIWKLLIHNKKELTGIYDREWEVFNYLTQQWSAACE
jgi:5'-deoxynucleotidase YfbR-like HD superfamily hydrolase